MIAPLALGGHIQPWEREPLERLAEQLDRYQALARTDREARKYAEQQETLRELVADPGLSSKARSSVLAGWSSTPAPGYWLNHWQQLTGAPREELYCQADKLLSGEPPKVREALAQLPAECLVRACQSSLGTDFVPPQNATTGELAAAAQAAQASRGLFHSERTAGMLRGLFQADLAPAERQRGFELVADQLHALRMRDATGYVAQVSELITRPELTATVRLGALQHLGPETELEHALEAARLTSAVAPALTAVSETLGFVHFNGVVLRKRVTAER